MSKCIAVIIINLGLQLAFRAVSFARTRAGGKTIILAESQERLNGKEVLGGRRGKGKGRQSFDSWLNLTGENICLYSQGRGAYICIGIIVCVGVQLPPGFENNRCMRKIN